MLTGCMAWDNYYQLCRHQIPFEKADCSNVLGDTHDIRELWKVEARVGINGKRRIFLY